MELWMKLIILQLKVLFLVLLRFLQVMILIKQIIIFLKELEHQELYMENIYILKILIKMMLIFYIS